MKDQTKIKFDRRIAAPDGIHDAITVNEYRPKCGWLEHYRRKDGWRDNMLAGAILLLYLAYSTVVFYWG